MGSNLSFECAADSIAEPGKKSVVSSAVDGVDASKLFEAFENYVRGGHAKHGTEAHFETIEQDGGVMAVHEHELPEQLGGGRITSRFLYKFDEAARTIKTTYYPHQLSYDKGAPATEGTLIVHADPVRMEFWSDAKGARSCGPFLKLALQHVFKEFGISAGVQMEAPSISEPDKLSIVSDAIEASDVSPETFIDKFRALLIEKGATELPNGDIIEDRGNMLTEAVAGKSFAKHVSSKEENRHTIYEYGDDESLTKCNSISYIQIHKEPFRVEQWNVAEAGRRAGDQERQVVEPWAKKVLDTLSS